LLKKVGSTPERAVLDSDLTSKSDFFNKAWATRLLFIPVAVLRDGRTIRVHYYCTVCDWSANTGQNIDKKQGRVAIDHYLATGHSIHSDNEGQHTGRNEYQIYAALK
jgi:hypothetical protein